MINSPKFTLLFLAISILAFATCTEYRREASAKKLHQLFDDYWEYILKSSPTFATYIGDHRYDDKLADVSGQAYRDETKAIKNYLDQLEAISISSLSDGDKLNHLIFERILGQRVERAKFRPYATPITQQDGPQIDFPQLTSFHPFNTAKDYQNYITRLQAFETMMDQTIDNMKTGLENDLVPARITIEKVIPQIEIHIVSDVTESVLYQPVENLPDEFSDEQKIEITTGVQKAIETSVVPAFQSLLEFVQNDYLPQCRQDAGIWALADGKERYANAVARYTTTSLTPTEIHAIGKRELARIHDEMRAIMKQVAFKGDLQAFIKSLKPDLLCLFSMFIIEAKYYLSKLH